MKVCASGFARNGLASLAKAQEYRQYLEREGYTDDNADNFVNANLYEAQAAIEGFYNTLLAMAQGRFTIEAMREFFFAGDSLGRGKFYDSLIAFTEDKPEQQRCEDTVDMFL